MISSLGAADDCDAAGWVHATVTATRASMAANAGARLEERRRDDIRDLRCETRRWSADGVTVG
jgi:hypothetical protein